MNDALNVSIIAPVHSFIAFRADFYGVFTRDSCGTCRRTNFSLLWNTFPLRLVSDIIDWDWSWFFLWFLFFLKYNLKLLLPKSAYFLVAASAEYFASADFLSVNFSEGRYFSLKLLLFSPKNTLRLLEGPKRDIENLCFSLFYEEDLKFIFDLFFIKSRKKPWCFLTNEFWIENARGTLNAQEFLWPVWKY